MFFSQKPTVHLPANKSAQIVVNFLPYEIGKRQCSIIFVNEDIGEFLYAIEGVSTMPLPLPIPFKPMPGSIRISSAVAAGIYKHLLFSSCTKCLESLSGNVWLGVISKHGCTAIHKIYVIYPQNPAPLHQPYETFSYGNPFKCPHLSSRNHHMPFIFSHRKRSHMLEDSTFMNCDQRKNNI